MSLKERLEGKQRRRLAVPILVTDPSEDQTALSAAAAALHSADERNDAGAAKVLSDRIDELAAKVQSHWAQVELQALPRDTWRAVTREWQTIEESDEGPQVVTNWAEALAPLLAESCVDPDLRDAEWWAEQLNRPEWSEGDSNALQMALLRLNVDAADPQIPKD